MQSHESKLHELGFPRSVIEESERAEERGLFDIGPSPDLVRRTIERCRSVLARTPPATDKAPRISAGLDTVFAELAGTVIAAEKAEERFETALDEIPALASAKVAWAELARIERLPRECLATANFARSKRQRPLVMVDNHNCINPIWWDRNSGFRAMRSACSVVNTIAHQSGAPPAAVLMVLRPGLSSYSDDDFQAIGNVLDSSTSDVWLIAYDMAGEYKEQDVIVFGNERILRLEGKPASPGDAFGAFSETENESTAITLRFSIEEAANRGIQVRSQGKFIGAAEGKQPIDAREIIRNVLLQRKVLEAMLR